MQEFLKKNTGLIVAVIIVIIVVIVVAVMMSRRSTERYQDDNQDGMFLGRGLPGRGPRLDEIVHDYPYRHRRRRPMMM